MRCFSYEKRRISYEKCRISYEKRRFSKDHLQGIVTLCFLEIDQLSSSLWIVYFYDVIASQRNIM